MGSIYECFYEQITQEKIGSSCPDHTRIHSVLTHNIQSIPECAGDPFLNGPEQMCLGMQVQVNMMEMYADDLVVEHSFRTIAKRLSLIHISEPTRLLSISYAVFCLKKKK